MASNFDDLILEDLNYQSYLCLDQLLQLQKLRSEPAQHDEMFFIIIHQTAELWFKEVLHETKILVEALQQGTVSRVLKVFKRIQAIMNLQVAQIRLLSTLTPVEFATFRDNLRPASGFQSAQFREIEFTYGLRNPLFYKFFKNLPEIAQRLERIQKAPSVYDEFMGCLRQYGFEVPAAVFERDFEKPWVVQPEVLKLIQRIYENAEGHNELVLLLESMLDFDEALIMWRKTHAVMVSRTIGQQKGTGGSAGYEFLKSREDLRCFPEIWEVRNHIGGSY